MDMNKMVIGCPWRHQQKIFLQVVPIYLFLGKHLFVIFRPIHLRRKGLNKEQWQRTSLTKSLVVEGIYKSKLDEVLLVEYGASFAPWKINRILGMVYKL